MNELAIRAGWFFALVHLNQDFIEKRITTYYNEMNHQSIIQQLIMKAQDLET